MVLCGACAGRPGLTSLPFHFNLLSSSQSINFHRCTCLTTNLRRTSVVSADVREKSTRFRMRTATAAACNSAQTLFFSRLKLSRHPLSFPRCRQIELFPSQPARSHSRLQYSCRVMEYFQKQPHQICSPSPNSVTLWPGE